MAVVGEFDDLLSTVILFGSMLAAAGLGQVAVPRLPEHHRSRETLDTVRLVSTFMVTFAALVLGLLIASVNTAFFTSGNDMNALAGAIRETDDCLGAFGPDTVPIRQMLRQYLAGAIASTWPEEPVPVGDYPRENAKEPGFESIPLGELLQGARLRFLSLDASGTVRGHLANPCLDDFAKALDVRWRLIGEAHSTISIPFYRVLFWMFVTVFACFGLTAPRNLLVWVVLALAALTIAVSVFVVLELDGPLDGLIKVSSASMRSALSHLAN